MCVMAKKWYEEYANLPFDSISEIKRRKKRQTLILCAPCQCAHSVRYRKLCFLMRHVAAILIWYIPCDIVNTSFRAA